MRIVKDIIVSGITMLLLDFAFLSFNKKAFEDQIINVQRVIMQMKVSGAIICYIFLIFGLYYFIIRNKRSILDAFLFGLVIYGVYETTNYATLKKWSPYLATMDTIWGGVLMASTTFITYQVVPLI